MNEKEISQQQTDQEAKIKVESIQRVSAAEARHRNQVESLQQSVEARSVQFAEAINALQTQQAGLEANLNQLPVGHPDRKKIEKALKNIKIQISQYQRSIDKLRSDAEAQKKVLDFSLRQQRLMVELKFKEGISLAKRAAQELRARLTKMAGSALASKRQDKSASGKKSSLMQAMQIAKEGPGREAAMAAG